MSRQDAARRIGYVPRSSSSPLATTVFDTFLMGRERPHMAGGSLDPGTWEMAAGVLERLLPERSGRARLFQGFLEAGSRKVLIARAPARAWIAAGRVHLRSGYAPSAGCDGESQSSPAKRRNIVSGGVCVYLSHELAYLFHNRRIVDPYSALVVALGAPFGEVG